MASRTFILFLPLLAISVMLGCGGGSTANVQNPPPPPVTAPSINFQPPPASSITLSTTTSLTAVVTNDPSNNGVDWSLTCQNTGNCGTLSSLHSASGDSVTYTPPSTFPGNSETVNIVAFATTDHNQNVAAPISITAFGSALKGTYVLQAQGMDSLFEPYQFAGVVVLDGSGGISSGEQTANFYDQDPNVNALVSRSSPITGGSYFVGADGRGTISIKTNDQYVGQNGTESLSFVALSPTQALIAQTDSIATASGTMDLQTNVSAPSGGYAFVVSGTDIPTVSPTAVGGVINIDSPNNISGAGSVADQNLAGTLTLKQQLSGTLSTPDAFGAITLDLTIPGFPSAVSFEFTGYIVDANHIKLIESDNASGAGSGSTGGVAIGQGKATGTFSTDASFLGTYVFGVVGTDLDSFAPNTYTSAGVFSADGAGNILNGFTDTFLQANYIQGTSGSQISSAFIGRYIVDTTGTGRARLNFSHLSPSPQPGFAPTHFVYLTGSTPLILDAGDLNVNLNYPSLGTGIAYPQASGPLTLNGKYGFNLVQQNGTESDGTGQIVADSNAGTISGIVDSNSNFNAAFNNEVSGTFQPPTNSRGAGTLSSQVFAFSPFTLEYYAIDPNHGLFVETDLADPNNPTGVVSFGYYATRTPVCTGCQ